MLDTILIILIIVALGVALVSNIILLISGTVSSVVGTLVPNVILSLTVRTNLPRETRITHILIIVIVCEVTYILRVTLVPTHIVIAHIVHVCTVALQHVASS